ncbi:MAG: 50S ribosomal protein L7/L12 [Candidatus Eisenbacteria sp.]|nr:50S ribosomal protein L7/L12 [Candidatus Eisenbacteria bacterium]
MSPAAKEPKEEAGTEKAEAATKEKATKKSSAKKDNVEKVIELIEKMTFLEVAELVSAMEEKFGVSAAAPAMVAAPAAGGDAGGAAEVKTEFDVHLTAAGDKKIQVIKVVRSILPQLGLKEAKALVDKAPTVVKEAVPSEEAEDIKAKLEEVGAQVEVK